MDTFHCLKNYDDFSVIALQKMQSKWPFEAFILEAQVCQAGPRPALPRPHEFPTVQITLRIRTYLFRTRTYIWSHCTVLAVTCSLQKISSCSWTLEALRKVCLKGKGWVDIAGFLIKLHHNVNPGGKIILLKFREQTKCLSSPSCHYAYIWITDLGTTNCSWPWKQGISWLKPVLLDSH